MILRNLIAIAGISGGAFVPIYLAQISDNSVRVGGLKVSSETLELDDLSNCYVLEKLDNWQLLVCSTPNSKGSLSFYLQELTSANKHVWKIKSTSFGQERDKSYFLRLNLVDNQTHNLIVKDPIKYIWFDNLEPEKHCKFIEPNKDLYCERISELSSSFTIISSDLLKKL